MSSSQAGLSVLERSYPTPSVYEIPRAGAGAQRWEAPPQLATFAEERLRRKQRLAAGFRVFAWLGFGMGGAGHITVRDPQYPDHFWVNPHGVYFGHVNVSNLILVNDKGEVVEGDGFLNQAAFAIHSELHKARPDVDAAAHAHSLYGKTWSTYGRLLDPITQDSTAFYEDHAVFDDFTGVVLDSSEGQRIADALGHRKAVILKNHGHLTVGRTVEAAVWRYIAFENAAQAQLLAQASGVPQLIRHDVAVATGKITGSEFGNWINFLAYWDRVIRQEPDFLL